jgi:predicted nuclease of restriction endonuclease-like (RecB) superfamily
MNSTDTSNGNSPGKQGLYPRLLTEIKERIRSAQYEALKSVNKELVGLYRDIGRMIAERQETEGWGKSVVKSLSADLQQDFPGVSGFSVQNLWYMRQFYSEYHGNERLQPLVGEIAWAHNLVIMSKCKDPLEREFYIRMTRKFGWSKNVLLHQIDNQSYEKSLPDDNAEWFMAAEEQVDFKGKAKVFGLTRTRSSE